jgi:hypothetical protein
MKRIKHTPSASKGTERVVIRFGDGSEVSAEGSNRPRRLVTDQEIGAKFRDCAGRVLSQKAVAEVEQRIAGLERETSLEPLMAAAGGRL